jgi:hypothetical protein
MGVMRTTHAMAIVAASFALALAACGGDEPVDAAGSYTISLTNRENGCMNGNWTMGETAMGIGVVITQNDAAVTADVQAGAARLALDVALGSHIFTGSVDGADIDLRITGTNSFSMGTCDYTVDADIDATLEGDVLSGNIYYRNQTDNSTDCGALTGCASRQEMLGNRPPS